MEAKQNWLVKFLQQQDTQFIIPVYQRNYDWRNEHCKQLLSDIVAVGLNDKMVSHFIGSIVYLNDGVMSTPNYLTIIDGQQRLTTITLIIAALKKKATENNNEKTADKLNRRFLINEDLSGEAKLKLRPIKKDDKALKFLIDNENNSGFSDFSRLVENYQYFYENIDSKQIDTIENGINKLTFIEIALERGKDDPQKIFQSLNSTGLDLSQADLIRNYILMGLKPSEQDKIYEKYWVEIEHNTTEIISKNSKLSDFIRDYLTFKQSKIPVMDKVFDTFKASYSFGDIEALIPILEDIKNYSKKYYYLINPEEFNDIDIRDNLKLIKKIQIGVAYPFLVQVLNDYDNQTIDKLVLISVLELVQSYVWRRFICNVATNALNKIFMDLYKDINTKNYLHSLQISLMKKKGSQRFPNNQEIEIELRSKDMYNIQPKNRIYFFERMENSGRAIKIALEGNADITIEHIFPQTPSKEWKDELKGELEEMQRYLNSASNLTLSAFNKELSNKIFSVKKDMPDKGYKFSPLYMDKDLCQFETWDLVSLEKRSKIIFERFKLIWSYPNIELLPEENGQEVNILNIYPDDIKSKQIEYFYFFNEKYDNPNWTELLQIVAKIMFEREPHVFLTSEVMNFLKLSLNYSEYTARRYKKISEVYYIDTNYSAKHIIERVQYILEKCDTNDDLIIKIK